MVNDGDAPRELSRLVVPQLGSLEATGDLFAPFRLVDAEGGGLSSAEICGGVSRNLMAGLVQRHGVHVQVTELCLLAKALRATSTTPESPANPAK
jgi:hypothetical protein